MSKQSLNSLPADEYMKKVEKATQVLRDAYCPDNADDLPFLMFLPHREGIMEIRSFPTCVQKQMDSPKGVHCSDVAYPLCNAIAELLQMKRSDNELSEEEEKEQTPLDNCTYQILTILLGELLAGGRVDDPLNMASTKGMRNIMQAIDKMHQDEDDEDEDEDDECACGDDQKKVCGKRCGKKGKKVVRGYAIDVDKLSIGQMIALAAMLAETDKDEDVSKEQLKATEEFLKSIGAKKLSKADLANKVGKDKITDCVDDDEDEDEDED